jgi:hypothetical protein
VYATAGNASALVNFTAPLSNGGSEITSYTVTSNPGNLSASGTESPITVNGLDNGTPYTFTVTATTAAGTGSASSATAAVTPQKSSQSITNFTLPAIKTYGDPAITLSATGGASGNPVQFSVVSGPATLNGSSLTFTGAGTVIIKATQAGNAYYEAAPDLQQIITVNKAAASAVLSGLSTTYDGTSKIVTAITTPNGLSYTVSYNSVVTAPTAAGSYPIVVTITDANYSGTATGTLVIAKASPAITWPTASVISLGQPLSDSNLTGGVSTPSGTFAFTTPATTPAIGTSSQEVTFTPGDINNYQTVSGIINVTVVETTLNVTLAGNGTGVVNSDQPDFTCTNGTCSKSFPLSTKVTLLATPSSDSFFGGWTGACSGSDACIVQIDNTKSVTATFSLLPPARLNRATPIYFNTIQAAYDAAISGDVIQLKEGTLVGALNANKAISVTLKGGYTASYGSVSGSTLLQGIVKVRLGTVFMDKIRIK